MDLLDFLKLHVKLFRAYIILQVVEESGEALMMSRYIHPD